MGHECVTRALGIPLAPGLQTQLYQRHERILGSGYWVAQFWRRRIARILVAYSTHPLFWLVVAWLALWFGYYAKRFAETHKAEIVARFHAQS